MPVQREVSLSSMQEQLPVVESPPSCIFKLCSVGAVLTAVEDSNRFSERKRVVLGCVHCSLTTRNSELLFLGL